MKSLNTYVAAMRTLDIEECAEFLKISKTTAIELAGDGVLPGAKVGRAWVFLECDLIDHLKEVVRQQQRERQEIAASGCSQVLMQKKEEAFASPVSQARNVRRPLPQLSC